MEQDLLQNIASIVLLTKYTIKSRENRTAIFFVLLMLSLGPCCNILGLTGWKVIE